MKRVHVAVGIIVNSQQQILLAKRHGHLHQGGKWEFPGGKVEADETVTQALIRELKEEVNLSVVSSSVFMSISHDYPDKQVLLDIHLVQDFSGEAIGVEGQQIVWVNQAQLKDYEFPEANLPILEKIYQELG
ncbi:mutator mutT protein [Shewanella denitrificans OS217]|uniref:8-oxo-dGTP diphosphatase n=1 Tax=Shewanella denitrificans (strain OS217 / ATCC BAA-1090 / DSM 15013) TaxID=318161 RepID=Q12IQ5_SHEDO|nr:8-oxo-dGTP diphosphatase MutT [Shewanella denitrificans]ABE56671.1 mutator mutT protein [Shewanella denitrificans OS217]